MLSQNIKSLFIPGKMLTSVMMMKMLFFIQYFRSTQNYSCNASIPFIRVKISKSRKFRHCKIIALFALASNNIGSSFSSVLVINPEHQEMIGDHYLPVLFRKRAHIFSFMENQTRTHQTI